MTEEKKKNEIADEGIGGYSFFHEKEIAKYSVSKDDWVVPENKKKKWVSSIVFVFLRRFSMRSAFIILLRRVISLRAE